MSIAKTASAGFNGITISSVGVSSGVVVGIGVGRGVIVMLLFVLFAATAVVVLFTDSIGLIIVWFLVVKLRTVPLTEVTWMGVGVGVAFVGRIVGVAFGVGN
jgi:hypothetical protein